MPKKQETASGPLPGIPEVAVTLQEDSSIAGKINLSVEDENRQLRERNRQLETENVILREREIALARDGIETLNTVTEALRVIQPGKVTARFLNDSKESIQNAAPEDRPFIINARIKATAAMIRDSTPAPFSIREIDGRFTYTTRTRNENRAFALVDHIKTTGKTSLKSTEARAILETVEHRKLDRKIVWRALEVAQGILRATVDKVGGVNRLILSAPHGPHHSSEDENFFSAAGGGGIMPRLRRWSVPWDG